MENKMEEVLFTCCFCGQKFRGTPFSAEPVIKKGECCDICYKKHVEPKEEK